ncbi:hypothetical protein DPMN_028492 [Dreissena polymorpha]|uniref:Uncharacterized protein n=1 Tax=Dreissena polymorpha TaxID=45954 RepID=A0A9D4RFD9_DREPO|nr:hypothetical protein DPMN_028492 [Dreissena polymorpha]
MNTNIIVEWYQYLEIEVQTLTIEPYVALRSMSDGDNDYDNDCDHDCSNYTSIKHTLTMTLTMTVTTTVTIIPFVISGTVPDNPGRGTNIFRDPRRQGETSRCRYAAASKPRSAT